MINVGEERQHIAGSADPFWMSHADYHAVLDEIERLQGVEGVAWDICGLQSTISHYLRGCHEQGLARRLEVFCDDLRALAAAAQQPSPGDGPARAKGGAG